ncbi:MAG: hypothetical protein HY660_11380, partial [Armatimonadetes bacterium]|nr:hypothetical protein [Armatimonadota bacterium]
MTASAFLISLAALLLEIAATRLLAVIQWYHYAFMILGLALLGYGAGGTLLVLRPGWARTPATAAWSAAAFGPAAALSYLALNRVPFDAYRLAVEPRQALYLGVQFAALGLPFLCAGLCVGALLAAAPRRAGAIYGASLIGSGAGALAAWVVMEWAGAPAAAAVAAALGPVAAVLGPAASDPVVVPGSAGALSPRGTPEPAGAPAGRYPARWRMTCAVLAAVLAAPAVRPVSLWEVRPSPYKGLNRLLTFPDARVMWTRWNAFSRVDVVASAAIRSAPGMSYLAASAPAPQLALLLDGETAGGIVRGGLSESAFTEALPSSVAYHLRRGPVLVLEAAGGLEVLGALRHGVSPVTLAESNPLVVEAVRRFGGGLLDDPRVRVVAEGTRSYVRRAPRSFQIIQVPMVEGFQVVASGAYSLGETYRLTVEAVRDYY